MNTVRLKKPFQLLTVRVPMIYSDSGGFSYCCTTLPATLEHCCFHSIVHPYHYSPSSGVRAATPHLYPPSTGHTTGVPKTSFLLGAFRSCRTYSCTATIRKTQAAANPCLHLFRRKALASAVHIHLAAVADDVNSTTSTAGSSTITKCCLPYIKVFAP